MDRRSFVKNSSLLAGALTLSRHAIGQGPHQPIGVQLYTVRQTIESDLGGVLKQIRAIGYEEVEPYSGIYKHPAKDLKRALSDNGLRAPSGHFDYDNFGGKLDYASELGMEYVVCPSLPEAVRAGGEHGFLEAAERLNHLGELVHARGMKFCYHNHNFEFSQIGSTTGYDLLLQHTDAALVGFELDCYWAAQAGRDPLQMIEQHKDRIQLLHIKDRKPGFPISQQLDANAGHFTEVGSGTIKWRPLLAAARRQGMKHFFVEQDASDRAPIESLKISYNYLHSLLP